MAIIDATNLILGRMATEVAKRSLSGESINIVNCEKAVITGNKQQILAKYKERRDLGTPHKGPFFRREPHMIVRRAIRGMLPYKRPRGKFAFKKVKCFAGLPEEFKDKGLETIEHANISKLQTLKYTTIETLSRLLGAKI